MDGTDDVVRGEPEDEIRREVFALSTTSCSRSPPVVDVAPVFFENPRQEILDAADDFKLEDAVGFVFGLKLTGPKVKKPELEVDLDLSTPAVDGEMMEEGWSVTSSGPGETIGNPCTSTEDSLPFTT